MKSDPTSVIVRCEGTAQTGLGHVSRCLAFTEALAERGIACRFLGRFEAGAEDLLGAAGVAFEESPDRIGTREDLRSTIDIIERNRADAVVLDSYLVDDGYVTALDREGAPVLLIDDFGQLKRYECSAVLNFTVNAKHLRYPHRNHLWLLGPCYLLVRRRLRRQRPAARLREGDVRRVLIALGGVDVLDLSRRAVTALMDVALGLAVCVVVGRGYRSAAALSALLARFREPSQVLSQLQDLADPLGWADLCICGGGLTKYESAYMGVPTAVLSQTAEQAAETVHFAAKGLAVDLGLGSQQEAPALAASLSGVIADSRLRAALSQAGLAAFPSDPTRRAADAFVGMLKARA